MTRARMLHPARTGLLFLAVALALGACKRADETPATPAAEPAPAPAAPPAPAPEATAAATPEPGSLPVNADNFTRAEWASSSTTASSPRSTTRS